MYHLSKDDDATLTQAIELHQHAIAEAELLKNIRFKAVLDGVGVPFRVSGKFSRLEDGGLVFLTEEELKGTHWDGQSVWNILASAGVRLTENPGCSACLGGPVDTFGRMNTPLKCISATNRNFPGRMGHKESQVFLASPYTVAASALTGKITDPREFIG